MEKIVRKFNSFEESDQADRRYYASLDPQERLDILLSLLMKGRAGQDEAGKGLKRVYRITELGKR